MTRYRVIACLAEQRQLPTILLPAGYTPPAVPGTDTIVCLLGGSNHLGFRGIGVIILSQKKYPDP